MLAKGSGKLRITHLVLEILKKGRRFCLDIQPIWVGRDNPVLQKADCLSKGIDSDNWCGRLHPIGREIVKKKSVSVFIQDPMIRGTWVLTHLLRKVYMQRPRHPCHAYNSETSVFQGKQDYYCPLVEGGEILDVCFQRRHSPEWAF
jgi:hypothetical protein